MLTMSNAMLPAVNAPGGLPGACVGARLLARVVAVLLGAGHGKGEAADGLALLS